MGLFGLFGHFTTISSSVYINEKGKIMLKNLKILKLFASLKVHVVSLQDLYTMTLNVPVISMSNKSCYLTSDSKELTLNSVVYHYVGGKFD